MRWWQLMSNPAVRKAGGVYALLRQARLAFRLLRDERVPMAVKLLVPGTLLYLASPLDFVPDLIPLVGQVDDIGILLLGIMAFIKLCPPRLVQEHEAALDGRQPPPPQPRHDEPIDARYRWVDDPGAR